MRERDLAKAQIIATREDHKRHLDVLTNDFSRQLSIVREEHKKELATLTQLRDDINREREALWERLGLFLEWAGSGNESANRLLAASIDPSRRGETLSVEDFVRLLRRSADPGVSQLTAS